MNEQITIGLVLYSTMFSDAGGENNGSSAIFERSLLDVPTDWIAVVYPIGAMLI